MFTDHSFRHSGKSVTNRESNHASGVYKVALRVVLCSKELHFVSRNWSVEN